MLTTEGYFGTNKLFYRGWQPEKETKAVIAIVHGGGEHSGRYRNAADYLVPRGYAVYAYDLRGHGKSPGKRGHVNRFREYLDDTDGFLNFVREQAPGKTVFLLGHSLGGVIAAAYALEHPDLPGLILSAPFLMMKLKVPGWKSGMAKVLSYMMPTLTLSNGLSADDLCRDKNVCEAYRKDTLVHDLASTRFYTEMLACQRRTLANAGKLKIPLLVLYGGDDRIADPEGSRAFYAGAGCGEKRIQCYEGYFHEIFNEKENEIVFKDILGWLEELITNLER